MSTSKPTGSTRIIPVPRSTNTSFPEWNTNISSLGATKGDFDGFRGWLAAATDSQDHDWYFGVDEAELQLNVTGTADNGLNYGFKIELNANTTDTKAADEVRLQFSGGWGTIQMGDEDGAEDVMNYGGENLMGATGGFDGDQDDYMFRHRADRAIGDVVDMEVWQATGTSGGIVTTMTRIYGVDTVASHAMNVLPPGYPTIAGDTSDRTKVSYFTPRFSGFQVGGSITPTPNNGDDFKADGVWENHIGLGANYDNSFGGLRIRASAVYSHATNVATTPHLYAAGNTDAYADVSAWSVGGIVGWGPFSLGANYTDNGDSGQPTVDDYVNLTMVTAPIETGYWNVAAGYEHGPLYFSVGYFSSWAEVGVGRIEDSTYDHLALTADYTVATGLGIYAEINMIDDELVGGVFNAPADSGAAAGLPGRLDNSVTSVVVGANISF